MRVVWVTEEPWPASPEVEAAALAAGAEQILHGIPVALADLIPVGTQGLVVLPDPDPVTVAPSVEDRLYVLLDALAVAGSLDEVRDAARQAAEGL